MRETQEITVQTEDCSHCIF